MLKTTKGLSTSELIEKLMPTIPERTLRSELNHLKNLNLAYASGQTNIRKWYAR